MSNNSVVDQMQNEAEENARKMEEYIEGKGDINPKEDSKTPKDDKSPKKEGEDSSPKPSDDDKSKPDADKDDSKPDADKDKPKPDDKKEKQEDTPSPKGPTPKKIDKTGESSAYEEVPECDIYGNIKPKEKAAKKDKPTPPDHGKPVKSGSEKNIMEMFWKEFILASYDWIINTAVDTVLDFSDFVLYGPKDGKENTPKEKTDVFAIGQKIRETTKEKMLKRKEVCNNAYNEILQNLEKDKNGEKVSWSMLKKEPKFFKELSQINKKNPEDRTPDEKEKLQAFLRVPEAMNKMIDVGIKSRELAIAAATCETAADKENGDGISLKFTQNLDKLEKALKAKNKVDIAKCLEDLGKEVEGKNPTFEAIKADLETIKQSVSSASYKSAKKTVSKIRETTKQAAEDPALCEAKIIQREKMYFSALEKERERISQSSAHTVSEAFTTDLALLNNTMAEKNTPPADKLTIIKELITKMDGQLDAGVPTQNKLKETLKKASDVVNDTNLTPEDAIEKIKEDIEKITEVNISENPNRYTVSKEFAEEVYDLSSVLKNKDLTPTQKVTELQRLTLSMDARLSDSDSVQKLMKDEVKKIQDTLSSTTDKEAALTAIAENVASITTTHKANNPVVKKTKEYFTAAAESVNTTKTSIETYQKSVVSRDGKKAKMNKANHDMKVAFIGGATGQSGNEYTATSEFSTQSMSQEIMRNIIQGQSRR